MLLDLHFVIKATREEENFVERKVADILRQILDPGMDDRQKTRAIHDYIVANVAYDLNYRDHSAYAALAKGRAVCQGYALLLYKMLDEAGVGVRIVSGEAGGEKHLWNMVNLTVPGTIDATWNDPVPDVPGRVRHDYYLKPMRRWRPPTPAAFDIFYWAECGMAATTPFRIYSIGY